MCQVLRMKTNFLIRALCFAQAMVHQTLQTGFYPCGDAELDQTASAIIGNKVRHSLRTTWRAKLYLTVYLDASVSEASPLLSWNNPTCLVGLRQSLARIIALLVPL